MSITRLISYETFSRLRLEAFVADDVELAAQVVPLADWEFLGGLWRGSAIGFTEFLELEKRPGELGSIALHAHELPAHVFSAICAALALPLRAGMEWHEIDAVLGVQTKTWSFVADQRSQAYVVGDTERYEVDVTVREAVGLTYVVVVRMDMLALCDDLE